MPEQHAPEVVVFYITRTNTLMGGERPATATQRARVAKPGNGGGLKIRSRRGPCVQIASLALRDATRRLGTARGTHAASVGPRGPSQVRKTRGAVFPRNTRPDNAQSSCRTVFRKTTTGTKARGPTPACRTAPALVRERQRAPWHRHGATENAPEMSDSTPGVGWFARTKGTARVPSVTGEFSTERNGQSRRAVCVRYPALSNSSV